MKKQFLFAAAIFTFHFSPLISNAQTWNTTGNAGTTPGTNFIGTTDAKDFVFKTNATEKGRVKSNGLWQFGATTNLAKIDSGGNLSFAGNAAYKVAGNKYAFQYSANPNYGLFFNSTGLAFEFRTSTALPVFSVGANSGNGIFKGNLKIGAYTLPATDGTSGQVLQTNGTGTVTWATVSGSGSGASTSLNNLVSTSINQSLIAASDNSIDLGSSSKKWRDIYFGRKIYLNGSLFIHNTGTDCSWFGAQSGTANTGSYNCGIGSYALGTNSTGYLNTAVGVNSLYNNLDGNSNTALGEESMFYNINGIENVAVGYASLANNLGGNFNTGIGTRSLFNNTTGFENTSVGASSLFSNINGYYNTAIGNGALYSNNFADNNTAVGYNTLYNNQTYLGGEENTGVGSRALFNNYGGTANVAVGFEALKTIINGGANVGIGDGAMPSSDYPDTYNSILIGTNAFTTNSNYAVLGNYSTVWNGGNVQWATFSDGRIKTNVKEDVSGLAFITKLRPVTYYRNISKQIEITGATGIMDFPEKYELEKIKFTGFIAQEVETAANECGYDFSGVIKPKNEKDLYSISYESFVVPLVKSVQELSDQNNAKDSTIAQQQKQIESLNSKLDEVLNKMNSFENSLSQCCSNYQSSTQLETINSKRETPSLEQNVPNPFNQSSFIKYFAPSSSKQIVIEVSDLNGRVIKTFSTLNNGFGTVNIYAGTFAAGTYQYTLFIDGNKIDSKEMVIVK